MCGIVGYIGRQKAVPIILEGLKRLEYRGYDSAGLAVYCDDGQMAVRRAQGKLRNLEEAIRLNPVDGSFGIGHTRWATHGGVTELNAHPHEDASGRVRIVLNGIIENYLDLRDRLKADGVQCRSDTDAEVVAQLIALNYDGCLADAVRRSLDDLSGHYAFVAMSDDELGTLVGVRRECPLVVGLGQGEQFIASSMSAFLSHTRSVAVLHDDEIAVMTPYEVTVFDVNGLPHAPVSSEVDWDDDRCEKEGYETFMLKEIHEQGRAVSETLSHWRASADALRDLMARDVSRIVAVACGTSYHAALAGRLAIERWARIPVDVEIASEFRYREPIIGPNTLVLGITQSGETADTLAAMRLARARGATVVAITNAPGSQSTRDADAVILIRAGVEIGVAATKTFVSQVALLHALALELAAVSGRIPADRSRQLQSELELLPARIDATVAAVDDTVRELAERLVWSPFFLYLGRLSGVPVALEGALKLKEIAYVPTDAYAAGEMKHGPIALLGPDTPVICVATDETVLPKVLSNLSEVRARGARVVAVATEGCAAIAEHAAHVVYVPRTDPLLQAALAIVPLQLFAYHVARARALNVDQPRNLAKTVTVE
jgi:glucosamine--fructose-6-phosphate aminotransferase (isomerizing)